MSRPVIPLALLCTIAVLMAMLLWPRPGPASANPLTSIAAVSAGGLHTCALTTAGGVKCWGRNAEGQLGNATSGAELCFGSACSSTPMDVSGLTSGVAAISVGELHTCALTTGGGVKCWGFNFHGQLGDGRACGLTCTTAVDVSGLTSGVAAISAGSSHTCALTTDGGVKCWGWDGYGQLGNGPSATDSTTPVDVSGLTSGVAAVSAGGYGHTCAVTTGGGVKCWGWDGYGQLGDGSTSGGTTPVDVVGLTSGATAVSARYNHTCAVTTGGGVKCWGLNHDGQLGDGTTTGRTTPVDVSGLTSGVAAVSAGWFNTCAVTTGGDAKCWGLNDHGQLGDGQSCGGVCTMPVDVTGLTSSVAAVSAGTYHTCAVTTGGGVKCWGWNGYGQLGDGATTDRTTPVDVLAGVKPTPSPTPCPTEGCPTATATLTPNPPPTPGPPCGVGIHVTVPAAVPWTDTGIDLSATDQVDVCAHGVVYIAGSDNGKNPDGAPPCGEPPPGPFLVPGLRCWALIGRIGGGTPFDVGTTASFGVVTSGRLYLGMNDNFYGDNVGSWDAWIMINGVTATPINTPTNTPTRTSTPLGTVILQGTSTPTRTPGAPLGGVAAYPDVSSGPGVGLLAGVIVAALSIVALGGAWYTRRRLMR